jgi:hypothetical protein
VAQRLIQDGEEVTRLVLIDSPPPLGLDRLPQRFYDFCGSVNIFDSAMNNSSQSPLSAELLAHFESTIEVLHDFYADPLPEGLTPLTTIIWAAECVFDGIKLLNGGVFKGNWIKNELTDCSKYSELCSHL